MPEMRMNSLKSRAMNCGPLSEMIRGLASRYFSCKSVRTTKAHRVRWQNSALRLRTLETKPLHRAASSIISCCPSYLYDSGTQSYKAEQWRGYARKVFRKNNGCSAGGDDGAPALGIAGANCSPAARPGQGRHEQTAAGTARPPCPG